MLSDAFAGASDLWWIVTRIAGRKETWVFGWRQHGNGLLGTASFRNASTFYQQKQPSSTQRSNSSSFAPLLLLLLLLELRSSFSLGKRMLSTASLLSLLHPKRGRIPMTQWRKLKIHDMRKTWHKLISTRETKQLASFSFSTKKNLKVIPVHCCCWLEVGTLFWCHEPLPQPKHSHMLAKATGMNSHRKNFTYNCQSLRWIFVIVSWTKDEQDLLQSLVGIRFCSKLDLLHMDWRCSRS